MSLTGHWVDTNFGQQSCCLVCLPFNEAHTAEMIKDALEESLELWQLPKNKCAAFTTDSGANIKAAIDMLGIPQLSCFDHTVQLGVEILLNSLTVKEGLDKCRKIGGFIAMSASARRELQRTGAENGMQPKIPPSVSKTRW